MRATAATARTHDRYSRHTCVEVVCAGCEAGVYNYDQDSDDNHFETAGQAAQALRGGGWAVGAGGLYCPECLVGQNLEPLTYRRGEPVAEPAPDSPFALRPGLLPQVECVSVHCQLCGRAFGWCGEGDDSGLHYETQEEALDWAEANDWLIIGGILHCPLCIEKQDRA